MEGATNLPIWEDPAQLAALYRNICMIVTALGALYITVLAFRRYKRESTWQIVFLGGLLLLFSYVLIIAIGMSLSEGGLGDSFSHVIRSGEAGSLDFVYLLKGGVLIAIVGAFSVAKRATS